jgi:hypothetical protein
MELVYCQERASQRQTQQHIRPLRVHKTVDNIIIIIIIIIIINLRCGIQLCF